jgi:hypothetical protein
MGRERKQGGIRLSAQLLKRGGILERTVLILAAVIDSVGLVQEELASEGKNPARIK